MKELLTPTVIGIIIFLFLVCIFFILDVYFIRKTQKYGIVVDKFYIPDFMNGESYEEYLIYVNVDGQTIKTSANKLNYDKLDFDSVAMVEIEKGRFTNWIYLITSKIPNESKA